MKLVMLVSISGTRDGHDWPARGREIEVSDVEAMELCRANLARPVITEPETETATPLTTDVAKAVVPHATRRPRTPKK